MKPTFSTENINFETPESMNYIFIQVNKEFLDGYIHVKMYIKFAFKGGDIDHWFLIDSIDPIRVFGGPVAFLDFPHYIPDEDMMGTSKEGLVRLVSSWTLEDFETFRQNAVMIGIDNKNVIYEHPKNESHATF